VSAAKNGTMAPKLNTSANDTKTMSTSNRANWPLRRELKCSHSLNRRCGSFSEEDTLWMDIWVVKGGLELKIVIYRFLKI